jgi:mRNA interferase HicA
MKRRDLLQRIEAMGCSLIRHGKRHDWYQSQTTKAVQPVPRHAEIRESLANHILKMLRP